jgi:hypothetical protein
MNKTAHTPGPWKTEGRDVQTADGLITVAIAHGPVGEWQKVRTEHEANARLIAAAPDLLEACERFMNCGLLATSGKTTDGKEPNISVYIHPELDAAIENARAAINKAKGE